jgi:hypothetical protein
MRFFLIHIYILFILFGFHKKIPHNKGIITTICFLLTDKRQDAYLNKGARFSLIQLIIKSPTKCEQVISVLERLS